MRLRSSAPKAMQVQQATRPMKGRPQVPSSMLCRGPRLSGVVEQGPSVLMGIQPLKQNAVRDPTRSRAVDMSL